MKKLNFILFAFLLISTQQAFSIEAMYSVDGDKSKKIDYLLVGQEVEVLVKSNKKNVYVQGKFGKSNSPSKKFSSVKLSHKVSKIDLIRGYIQVEVFFQEKVGGPVVDSYVKVLNVTSLNAIVKDSKITDEQRAENLFREWENQADDTSRGSVKERESSETKVPTVRNDRGK